MDHLYVINEIMEMNWRRLQMSLGVNPGPVKRVGPIDQPEPPAQWQLASPLYYCPRRGWQIYSENIRAITARSRKCRWHYHPRFGFRLTP